MLYPATANSARISEIFSSLQGEGIHLGERHLFIRFEECHLQCDYCDERGKPATDMTLDEVYSKVHELEKEEGPHTFVSLTGGEPLMYLPFLKTLMMKLRQDRFRIYLETNGVLWQQLEEVISWCDSIAMDMKPASVTKEQNFEEEHYRFLEIAKSTDVFIKIVISRDLDMHEFENLVRIVADIDPNIPVVLIPVSGQIEGHEDPGLMQMLSHLQRIGLRFVPNIKILPRFHKILDIP